MSPVIGVSPTAQPAGRGSAPTPDSRCALDSEHADLSIDRINIATLIRDAITAASQAARHCSVRLVTDAPETLMIAGGDIAVTLIRGTDDHAVITVTDTGIGIPTDELTRVFERFHRSSRVRELGIPGTGLGLTFSRVVLDRHHGNVALHPSAPGGTTATVSLPLRQLTR